jgi:hypothetical protein
MVASRSTNNNVIPRPKKSTKSVLSVSPPKFQYIQVKIIGSSIYCQNKFGKKALEQMRQQQVAGSTAKTTKTRVAKDFDQQFEDAKHISTEGWCGIPAAAFRTAMIDACRTAGVVMTRAKLAVFVVEDGYDATTDEPLIKITKGEPYKTEKPVRNESGVVDIRARPTWDRGWEAIVTIRFDADMIGATDIINLLVRVGLQVGIGEGRPSSKKSNGLGWGLFDVETEDDDVETEDDEG